MLAIPDSDKVLYDIDGCKDLAALESLRVALLGKSGSITKILQQAGALSPEERKKISQTANNLKNTVSDAIAKRRVILKDEEISDRLMLESVDITLPELQQKFGQLHPLTKVFQEVTDIFTAQGFAVASGQDLEREYFNFTALNMPESHPARQMHDTFYIKDDKRIVGASDEKLGKYLLRTHTSPVQIHSMLRWGAPLRVLVPGRTFRCDYDATHSPMFHQAEVLVLDKGISFAHLKGCITDFCRKFFEISTLPMRIRPGYFPFTEPSAEIDIPYHIKDKRIVIGQSKTEENKWLEIAGCGMVHPEVLRHGKIDAEQYQGFAMGWGLDRLAILKYGAPDIRGFFEADVDWIERYGFSAFA
ncbi:MAG: phenylalanine--tRNA ligase subunit alpha [Holosporales bacterium]|jgi:phenylalanyl-tRNA synthetase alpha chain|nr:phenylalanine--tRNA ligase subunit alpha [Holosporales bacterium]